MLTDVSRSIASLLIAWSLFSRPDPDVAEGNRLYGQGKYAQAIERYDKARAKDEAQRHKLEFNRGTAQLKLGKFKEARDSLRQAQAAADADLRARAAYNRGNAAMMMKDLPAAVQAYRQALRDKPDMQQALHNLDLALRMMRRPDAGQPDAAARDAGPRDAQKPDAAPDAGADGGPKNQADGGSAEGGQQQHGDGGTGAESGSNSGLDGGVSADAGGGAAGDAGAGNEAGAQQDAASPPRSQKNKNDKKPKKINKQDALKMLDALRDSERDKMLMRFLQQEKSQQKNSVEKNW